MRRYKIIVMGASGVGKSAITIQYVQRLFTDNYDPTIEDVYKKWAEVDGNYCRLEIVDTAGTKQFDAMRDLYIKEGDGFVLVFSVTCRESLSEVRQLRNQILRIRRCDDVPIVMVANKTDLNEERVLSRHEGVITALDCNHCAFVECSAKTGHNVSEVFDEVVRQIFRKESQAIAKINRKTVRCRCVIL